MLIRRVTNEYVPEKSSRCCYEHVRQGLKCKSPLDDPKDWVSRYSVLFIIYSSYIIE